MRSGLGGTLLFLRYESPFSVLSLRMLTCWRGVSPTYTSWRERRRAPPGAGVHEEHEPRSPEKRSEISADLASGFLEGASYPSCSTTDSIC